MTSRLKMPERGYIKFCLVACVFIYLGNRLKLHFSPLVLENEDKYEYSWRLLHVIVKQCEAK